VPPGIDSRGRGRQRRLYAVAERQHTRQPGPGRSQPHRDQPRLVPPSQIARLDGGDDRGRLELGVDQRLDRPRVHQLGLRPVRPVLGERGGCPGRRTTRQRSWGTRESQTWLRAVSVSHADRDREPSARSPSRGQWSTVLPGSRGSACNRESSNGVGSSRLVWPEASGSQEGRSRRAWLRGSESNPSFQGSIRRPPIPNNL
jgi:hypothetical protein